MRNAPVYWPLVDLETMKECHIIMTYRLNRVPIKELVAQLELDLLPALRNPHAISPTVPVLAILHFLSSRLFQVTVGLAAEMSQPKFSKVLQNVLDALLKLVNSYIRFPPRAELPTVKAVFYNISHIPHVIGAIDWTHIALVPQRANELVYRNQKSDSGYPNLPWLLTLVRQLTTEGENRYNEVCGWMRRMIEMTFGLLKARFCCLHVSVGALQYRSGKVCKIVVACSMLNNLAFRIHVTLLEVGDIDAGAVVEAVNSDTEKADEAHDKRTDLIRHYFR
ncbi:putative nuclease HARBI1 [Pleurodeles waltl]|uniref:putative nuclease HARBI1 n=1 Tax=Pleurodeles waltl TaxID=8319 RepID=UPI003709A276